MALKKKRAAKRRAWNKGLEIGQRDAIPRLAARLVHSNWRAIMQYPFFDHVNLLPPALVFEGTGRPFTLGMSLFAMGHRRCGSTATSMSRR